MAPQPLSRVRPDARLRSADPVHAEDPYLWVLAAHVVSVAADIESLFGTVLRFLLDAKGAAPTMAMYSAMNTKAQMDAIGAAADAVLTGDALDAFHIVQRLAKSAMKDRHRLAHWVWADCQELPDALCFVDPISIARGEPARMTHPADGRELRADPDHVYVYRKKDLSEAAVRLMRARDYVALLGFALHPAGARANMLQRLLAEPEVGQAYRALLDRRQTNPEARPRRRRAGRTEK